MDELLDPYAGTPDLLQFLKKLEKLLKIEFIILIDVAEIRIMVEKQHKCYGTEFSNKFGQIKLR